MSGSLETIDVTNSAEDNDELQKTFQEKTGYEGKVEGWIIPGKVIIRGPYTHDTAVVIKFKSGDGTIRIFAIVKGVHRDVTAYETSVDSEDSVTMVLLKPDHYCWLMGHAQVKYIK